MLPARHAIRLLRCQKAAHSRPSTLVNNQPFHVHRWLVATRVATCVMRQICRARRLPLACCLYSTCTAIKKNVSVQPTTLSYKPSQHTPWFSAQHALHSGVRFTQRPECCVWLMARLRPHLCVRNYTPCPSVSSRPPCLSFFNPDPLATSSTRRASRAENDVICKPKSCVLLACCHLVFIECASRQMRICSHQSAHRHAHHFGCSVLWRYLKLLHTHGIMRRRRKHFIT